MANPNPTPRTGRPNKVTKGIKDAILASFEKVGGEEYLVEQALQNPTAYMALIGKIIPKDINASIDGELNITSITRKIVDAHRDSNS